MRYLLDTNTFIWSTSNPDRLSRRVHDLLLDATNEVLLSHASVWEMATKVRSGKLRFQDRLADLLPRELQNHSFVSLGIDLRHLLAVAELPLVHRDPFDRLLVCQSQIENLPILTNDRAIAQYNVQVIW